jgi:hypothetical protein
MAEIGTQAVADTGIVTVLMPWSAEFPSVSPFDWG